MNVKKVVIGLNGVVAAFLVSGSAVAGQECFVQRRVQWTAAESYTTSTYRVAAPVLPGQAASAMLGIINENAMVEPVRLHMVQNGRSLSAYAQISGVKLGLELPASAPQAYAQQFASATGQEGHGRPRAVLFTLECRVR